MSSNLSELLSLATAKLAEVGSSDSSRLDVELLLAHVLDCNRTWLFTWPEYELTDEQIKAFDELLNRRMIGEPIAYILKKREFWGLTFECNESTLIPRPDTELLIDTALSLDLPEKARVLDLGTGTGAIALALASEKPNWRISAVDISSNAIALAKRNAQSLKLESIDWYCGSWFEPIPDNSLFDLIISNPPYVEANSPWLHQGDVRFEPKTALTAGVDGMDDFQIIAREASIYLVKNGFLLLEHGFEQAELLTNLLHKQRFQSVQSLSDLAGLDRAVLGVKA